MEDTGQGWAPDSSADSHVKGVEFSDGPKRPDGSDKDSSDLNVDEPEATQEQSRPLKRSDRVSVPPTRYDWENDHVSFALVAGTWNPISYMEVIEADDHNK